MTGLCGAIRGRNSSWGSIQLKQTKIVSIENSIFTPTYGVWKQTSSKKKKYIYSKTYRRWYVERLYMETALLLVSRSWLTGASIKLPGFLIPSTSWDFVVIMKSIMVCNLDCNRQHVPHQSCIKTSQECTKYKCHSPPPPNTSRGLTFTCQS